MVYIYEIKNEDDNTRATRLVNEKLGFNVKVEINKETGTAIIITDTVLPDEDITRIRVLLKEYGFIG